MAGVVPIAGKGVDLRFSGELWEHYKGVTVSKTSESHGNF